MAFNYDFILKPILLPILYALKYNNLYFLINPKCSLPDFSTRLSTPHFIGDIGPFVFGPKLFDSHFVSDCLKRKWQDIGADLSVSKFLV